MGTSPSLPSLGTPLDQFGLPTHLHAAEWPHGLEDDQHTTWVAGQVAHLYVPLGDHDPPEAGM